MGARQKLNNVYVTTILITAAIIALLTQSTLVFLLSLGLLMASNLDSGNIRFNKPRR